MRTLESAITLSTTLDGVPFDVVLLTDEYEAGEFYASLVGKHWQAKLAHGPCVLNMEHGKTLLQIPTAGVLIYSGLKCPSCRKPVSDGYLIRISEGLKQCPNCYKGD